MDEAPPTSEWLAWDANAGAFGPAPKIAEAGYRFIKGPLPYSWMKRAGELPGKTLHVALGLWLVAGLRCSRTFSFKRKAAGAFGASKDATYDALTRLEAAGLISVDRRRGRSPTVTILDV